MLTVLVIAAVVGVFSWMLGFAEALRSSLSVAADEDKIIVLKRGSTAESNSAIPVDEFNKLTQVSGIAAGEGIERLISPEMVVQVSLPRLRDGGETSANVCVRGVTAEALKVHDNVRLLGPFFSEGAQEVIVGRAAAEQFAGLDVGEEISLGYGNNRVYKVVGHFSADGGPLESEIWGYLPSLLNAYNRTMYSSASLCVAEGTDPRTVLEQIEGPAIQLTARTEKDYWQEQSQLIRVYLLLANVLVAIMSLAAMLSIANTMFSMVAGRTAEIAMLRTIGFRRNQILTGFMVEATLLSLLGGAMGCLGAAAWLQFVGNTKDMFGAQTFTILAFEIHLTPMIILLALLCVSLVGALGALLPALRAARLDVVTALREG